jgi:DNA polymerase I-like protein with 3'-5' exonuclease and polymerase domains
MVKIIQTHEVGPGSLSEMEKEWVYNGLDCALTYEILEVLKPQLDNATGATYEFSKALQGPVLEMKLRGVKVDQWRKQQVIDEYADLIDRLDTQIETLAVEGVGMPSFNWRSPADKVKLFYEYLQIPIIKKQGRPTTDANALEKLEAYLVAKPLVHHLQALNDLGKKMSFLKTGIDPDGRIRTSYNIAGTDTGRFSSSYSEYGTGTNLQNVEESLRSIFIADEGMKFAKFDAKSGESYIVGAIEWNLFGDDKYLSACESGDVHTATAKICWPKLPWTGNLKQDKQIAEQPYFRHYDYRFMCKKLGHGSNYRGMPNTLSTQSRVPLLVVVNFQNVYFKAFPAHVKWHMWVDETIRRDGMLTSLTGRKRQFWGRRNDDSTLRAAIAYDPQGSLADIVNQGMLNLWRRDIVTIMMQDHDAITIQYPEAMEDEVIPQVLELLRFPIELRDGRTLEIPYDAQVGWNKGKYHPEKNPMGLKDYAPGDRRKREKPPHILDRTFR